VRAVETTIVGAMTGDALQPERSLHTAAPLQIHPLAFRPALRGDYDEIN
jgi:hypothetical protein